MADDGGYTGVGGNSDYSAGGDPQKKKKRYGVDSDDPDQAIAGGRADTPNAQAPGPDDAGGERRRQYDLMRQLEMANVPIVRDRFGNEIHPDSQVGGGPGPLTRIYPNQPFGGYFQTYRQQAKEHGFNPEVYARAGGFIGRGNPSTFAASRNLNLLDIMESRGVDPTEVKNRFAKTPLPSTTPSVRVKSAPSEAPAVKTPAPYTQKTAMRGQFPELAAIWELIDEAYA